MMKPVGLNAKVCTLLLGLFALLPVRAGGVDSLLHVRQSHFDSFARQFPQERVYVHFDNTSYYKGENIWYKAYVVRDDNEHFTNLSRILYVELLSPIGYPVETQKLIIENGQAHGSFELKDTLNAGFYEVRAYTSWMLNFTTGDEHGWQRLSHRDARRQYGDRLQRYLQGNAGIFSRVFPVYEAVDSGRYHQRRIPHLPKATATLVTPDKDRLQMDFYPEGGQLVRDVPGRVAFQAHNTEGRTLNVAGALLRRGDSIGYFKTDYAGRGVFSVTPDSLDAEELTEGLKLRLTYAGRKYTFDLPRPQRRGYVLSAYPTASQLRVIVARNARTKGLPLGLSITSRGQTSYFGQLDLTATSQVQVTLDNKTLQTGVNVVTLFTADGHVLAQRLVFVNNHDRDGFRLTPVNPTLPIHPTTPTSPINPITSTLSTAPYQKQTLDYQLTDAAGHPVREAHDFSLAVTDGDYADLSYDDRSALSYLLLGSEVKGFIPHPEYYFEADDQEHRAALDLLMLVQGWTRYDYEQMLSGQEFNPMLPIERGLSFSGRIWDDRGYHPRVLWKDQKQPLWIYSELYIDGDTVPTDHGLDYILYPETMFRSAGRPQLILTGEAQSDSTGFFRLNIQPFCGKGRIALMLNKASIDELGILKGGVGGHNFRWNTVKRPKFLLDKRIEPLNQYSPLPKDYDYYETAALADPMQPDIFRKGFMAVPQDYKGQLIYYDPLSQSYMLPEVQKRQRRRWSDFRGVTPVCVTDVKDLMAWLSNIFGDVSDFNMFKRSAYASDDSGSDFEQQMRLQDALDRSASLGEAMQNLGQTLSQFSREAEAAKMDLESNTYFANLFEMLYIFGLDGMNKTFVGAGETGGDPHYTMATGSEENLPLNIQFFPINENFHELKLYADTDNRRLTHRRGRYNEMVFAYNSGETTSDAHPLTSIINFTIDSIYDNNVPLPDFLGFRINFQGFNRPAEFYHPDYDWEPEPEETDYRRTVYWNPMLRTDEEGRVHVEFFNNGFSKSLRVSAEGVTAGGQPILNARP
ncbi:MAG: hypothetical protein IJ570_09390 [Prevotella sp.]|nr:hypothetical protein [Prevotella sp.]